jgi:pyridoxal phosphate enzyme (YggS family)
MNAAAPGHPAGTDVAGAIARVRGRIDAAARRAGRDPAGVTLVGVTKTVDAARVREAVEAGLRDLGENRVQEAEAKMPLLEGLPVRWHLIGHLQSNKAARAAGMFDRVHSVDREEVALRLDRAAAARPAPLPVLIQVDLGREPTKHGVREEALPGLLERLLGLKHLHVQGLMTIPPESADPEGARPWFRRLRELRDGLSGAAGPLPELSMGMTEDFEVAVEEGATLVRVGRAIFGDRPPVPA